ncbi:type VI secretion system membrane subunit TssM [Myxococcus sp. K15C18031901]|uniref:type VI secretion system membrane subunit TssM n=1 Tax=Myxococcus dinghuensis TaxID=2906761 RepID=UPI0020A81263|nr:type VI secretion system membrane subunit TssM [Myxococcus dinghuensis]MCP3098211.1 type VI secretion system membrane subunit TssM [Myxococcus dinghuensis]
MLLLTLFIAVFIIMVWTVAILFSLPLWGAIVPTVLLVAIVIGAYLYQRHLASKAARDIERELGVQADAQLQNVRPDQQEEIQAMQAEFSKALQSLKSSKLARARQGKDALSVLPWYMIIGPPGSGKSTALRNSGIQFPYLSARGGGVKGVGGTRNCEWWLTNEGVILDTAGRYTTEDDDREEWLSFLDMLKRNRPRKPVNGLVVAVSVGELIGIDEEQTVQLAQTIRERVDEVMERLKMIVPVYVMFTKCDLLAGFVDLFGDLAKTERGQIWGFTLRPEDAREAIGETFAARFDELAEVVEQRSIVRLGSERHPETRERIFRFPQQFEGLRGNLIEFVQALFAENVYADTPVMRGVYFTSGTQEGSPIDRVMNKMAEAFGIRRTSTPPGSRPAVESRSYFLRDMFADVVFPDQNLAMRSSAEEQRQKRMQLAYAGGCLAVALLILLFPAISFFENRKFIQTTRGMAQALKLEAANKDGGAGKMVDAMMPMRQRLDQLLQWKEEGPPTGMRFGMYRGDDLLGPLGAFYGATVRRVLVDPVLAGDLKDAKAWVEKARDREEKPSEGAYALYFDRLKLHLLLSGPRTPREPELGEAEREWIVTSLRERWGRKAGFADSAQRTTQMANHIDLYVKLLAQDPALAFVRNDQVVRDVRVVLDRLPFSTLALAQIVSEVSRKKDQYDVTLSSVLGSTAQHIKGKGRVRAAFTRKGWEKVVAPKLEHPLQGADIWVLDKDTDSTNEIELARQERALRSAYYKQYIEEWQEFIGTLSTREPNDVTDALAMLEDLTRGEPPPLGKLFRAVAYNVRLGGDPAEGKSDDEGMLDKLKQKLGPKGKAIDSAVRFANGKLSKDAEPSEEEGDFTAEDVEPSFAGLLKFGAAPPQAKGPDAPPPESIPLDIYQEQLKFLRDEQRTAMDDPSQAGAMMTRVQTARVIIQSLIQAQEVGWRPPIHSLLWPPIEKISELTIKEQGGKASDQWCSEVANAFKQKLAGHYPFNRNGQDAAVADVGDFYRFESGTLWGFYGGVLKNHVEQSGTRFKFVTRAGRAGGNMYFGSVLSFLARSREISESLFSPRDAEPGVKFAFHIRPSPKLSSIRFTVDGQTVEYNNGPEEWHNYEWPGKGGKSLGATIRVRNNQGKTETLEQEGEWGLFRLMEEGTPSVSGGARSFSVTWSMPSLDTEVVIDFRPTRSASPFFGVSAGGTPRLMQPFRMQGVQPPRVIAKGGTGCSG